MTNQRILSAFMADVRRCKPLTREAEIQLVKRGDGEARQQLVQANLWIVFRVARRYRSYGVPFVDLIQEGTLGLIRALDKFDVERGYRLATYAQWWVRQTIQRYIARARSTVRRNNQPVPPFDTSLDEPTRDCEGTRIDRLESTEPAPDETAARHEASEAVWADLGRIALDEREAYILCHRLAAVCGRETLASIGRRFGITRERVRQIESALRARLRAELEHLRPAAELAA